MRLLDWLSENPLPSFALRTSLDAFSVTCFAVWAILKYSSFLPPLSAAATQRGVSPRPAKVSLGFAGLRYFGATGLRAPILSLWKVSEKLKVARVCRA